MKGNVLFKHKQSERERGGGLKTERFFLGQDERVCKFSAISALKKQPTLFYTKTTGAKEGGIEGGGGMEGACILRCIGRNKTTANDMSAHFFPPVVFV